MVSSASEETNPSTADQRQNLRAPLIIQKVHIDAERPVFFGYSKNISRSGLFIATTNTIAVGEQLNLDIPLPMQVGESVRCCCEVVWRRPLGKHLPFEPGIGLKFIDMPAMVSQQIDDWIREQKSEDE